MRFLCVFAVLLLSACGTQSPAPVRGENVFQATQLTVSQAGNLKLKGKESYRIAQPIQCVPYTRELSGVNIFGNAHTWWASAKGKYQRGHKPRVGAVLVNSKTKRNPHGHISTVSGIKDSRNITVAHSNWGGTRSERSIIYERMPVQDVSEDNDWSKVRFFHYPSKTYGRVYPVSGFIYP